MTLVTISGNRTSKHYLHPYDLITTDPNTIPDKTKNSWYFRINDREYVTRVKRYWERRGASSLDEIDLDLRCLFFFSFSLMILKKKQEELQSVKMRVFNLGKR